MGWLVTWPGGGWPCVTQGLACVTETAETVGRYMRFGVKMGSGGRFLKMGFLAKNGQNLFKMGDFDIGNYGAQALLLE